MYVYELVNPEFNKLSGVPSSIKARICLYRSITELLTEPARHHSTCPN